MLVLLGTYADAFLLPLVVMRDFLSSRGRVYLFIYFFQKPTELAHSFLFCSCNYFCLYDPFNCISFHTFYQQLFAFSLCSSALISTLLILSTTYLFMKVSFSPDLILCGWLGLTLELTNLPRYLQLNEPLTKDLSFWKTIWPHFSVVWKNGLHRT